VQRFDTTDHSLSSKRIAIVHDWLLGMRGGERVLEIICDMFPRAEIFTGFYQPEEISPIIKKHKVVASRFNNLPGVHSYYRHLLPIYPLVARDIGAKLQASHSREPFEFVLSVSHCFAKNIPLPSGVKHLSYCLTPMRYIWDQFDAYFGGRRIEPLAAAVAKYLRSWDQKSNSSVTEFVGISNFVSKRIARVYGRNSAAIYPPVPTNWLSPAQELSPDAPFVVVNALVPYKNTHKIVEAFTELGHNLLVVGEGPERKHLESIAGPNIKFVQGVSDDELAEIYRSSRALIFAAEEDFGMTPVEMQASGRPVIAYGKGGALETVNWAGNDPSGVLFSDLTTASIGDAVSRFVDRESEFTVDNCIKQAGLFRQQRFEEELILALRGLLPEVATQRPRAVGEA
jgi:glycosyltransferase involved in cell wall biosynthesis